MPLITSEEFNADKLIFSTPEENQIPASKLKYKKELKLIMKKITILEI